MELFLIKTDKGYFLPMYNSDREVADKIRAGEELKCKLVRPRNVGFHKKFMALVNLGYENQDRYDNFDDFREVMTMKAGFYRRIITDKGELFKAKSISFTKMEEPEFEDLFSKMLDVMAKELDLTNEEVMQELVNFM